MTIWEKVKDIFTPHTATDTTSTATVVKPTPTTTPVAEYIPAHPTTQSTTLTNTKVTPVEATSTRKPINIEIAIFAVALTGAAAYHGYKLYQAHQQAQAKQVGASSAESHLAYPVVVVDDPTELDQIITETENRKKLQTKVFILIEGAKEGASNLSWCPDSVKADPIIKQVFEENCDRVILIDAPVKREGYKGNARHPYRTHPELKVQRIPTLYKWENGHVVDQLVESELFDIDRVRRFVRSN